MAVDPVCKMQVNEQNPPGGKTVHQGQTYYFCGPGCKRTFERNPQQFLGSQGTSGHGGHSGHSM